MWKTFLLLKYIFVNILWLCSLPSLKLIIKTIISWRLWWKRQCWITIVWCFDSLFSFLTRHYSSYVLHIARTDIAVYHIRLFGEILVLNCRRIEIRSSRFIVPFVRIWQSCTYFCEIAYVEMICSKVRIFDWKLVTFVFNKRIEFKHFSTCILEMYGDWLSLSLVM